MRWVLLNSCILYSRRTYQRLKVGPRRRKLPHPVRELLLTPCRLCGRRVDLGLRRRHQRGKELCVLLARLLQAAARAAASAMVAASAAAKAPL